MFGRKALHVSPVTPVINNVQSASAADSLGGPPNFYASLLPCRGSPHFVQGSTPPPRSLGFDPFCPIPESVNLSTTGILNQRIICCGDFVGLCVNRVFCSIPDPLCYVLLQLPSPTSSCDNKNICKHRP